jgi:cation:H+ antiporter
VKDVPKNRWAAHAVDAARTASEGKLVTAIVQFLILAAIIIVAGTVLTRCADAIAELTGLGGLLVGSVLLAGATSLPELTVDISAIRLGLPNLAVGDLLGSSLMNLLILAVMDLSHRSGGRMLSRAAVAHALSGTLAIALTAMVGVGILVAPQSPGAMLWGVHAAVWLVAIAYALGVRVVYLDQRIAARQPTTAGTSVQEAAKRPAGTLRKYVLGFLVAGAVILLTGPKLAESAGEIAELSGLGGTFVGTTFVALSTSLPELVASITAVRMGAFELVVGNVFGSNAFNMMLFLPLDFMYPGSLFAAVSTTHLISVLTVIVATSVVIMGQLYQSELRTRLLEPDAWLVIVLVVGALFLVYRFANG